jgi:hypothetical protein
MGPATHADPGTVLPGHAEPSPLSRSPQLSNVRSAWCFALNLVHDSDPWCHILTSSRSIDTLISQDQARTDIHQAQRKHIPSASSSLHSSIANSERPRSAKTICRTPHSQPRLEHPSEQRRRSPHLKRSTCEHPLPTPHPIPCTSLARTPTRPHAHPARYGRRANPTPYQYHCMQPQNVKFSSTHVY